MHRGQQRVIAELIASTVRVLELLGFEYEVSGPRNQRRKGNKSPRVVYVQVGKVAGKLRVYNSASGHTWANEADGTPISSVHSIEALHLYLEQTYKKKRRARARTR